MENYLTHEKARELKARMQEQFRHPRFEFTPERSALLVIDMQETFKKIVPSFDFIVPNISALIGSFQYVIFTKHINTPQNAALMAEWWNSVIENDEIISDFNTNGHIVIEKSQYNAFYNTDLEKILRELKVESLAITGVLTHLCCETTAREAFVRGFKPFFVVDATATYNEEFHKSSVLNLSHGFAVPVLTEEILSYTKV